MPPPNETLEAIIQKLGNGEIEYQDALTLVAEVLGTVGGYVDPGQSAKQYLANRGWNAPGAVGPQPPSTTTPPPGATPLPGGGFAYKPGQADLQRYADQAGEGITAQPGSAFGEYLPGTTPSSIQGAQLDPFGRTPRAIAFEEQESTEGGLGAAFRQYLANLPGFGGLSGLGQRALESQFDPASLSFRLRRPAEGEGQTSPALGFREFLGRGGGILNPAQARSRLGELAGRFGTPTEQLGADAPIVERLRENPQAFSDYLDATLQGMHPFFRGAAANAAQRVFDKFMGQTPEQSFLPFVSGRGGFFGR